MKRRGYSAIGLLNPKTPANVGSVMRAAGCFGSSVVLYSGRRYEKAKQFVTDTTNNYRRIPLIGCEDLSKSIPFDCVPIAVELSPKAKTLLDYKHPPRAFYVFGPEDGTLGKRTLDWCRDVLQIPTEGCLNLAACVNIVLYDRLLKERSER